VPGTYRKGATDAENGAARRRSSAATANNGAQGRGPAWSDAGPREGAARQAVISTVVVDPAPLFRSGAKAALASRHFPVLGEAAGVPEGIELARRKQARVIVLGGVSASEAVEAAASLPECAVVALLAHARRPELVEMLSGGVAGLALRSLSPEELLDAVETVANGDRSVEPALVPLLAGFGGQAGNGLEPTNGASLAADGGTVLTSKERLVLAQLARGASNSQIAHALYVTPATVKTHLAHIYSKLGAAGRHEALSRALELGLLN
jgi:DNA-binding NarL/FixJ family response regulator